MFSPKSLTDHERVNMTEQAQGELQAPPHNDNPQRQVYWGQNVTERFLFPDGQTYIEYKKMLEGDRARYQRRTTRDIVLERQGDSRLKVDMANDRHELIKAAVVGWNLLSENGTYDEPLNQNSLEKFLAVADPKLIDDLEKAIRKFNPWLQSDVSSEDIRKEIEELEKQYDAAKRREEGEDSSSSR